MLRPRVEITPAMEARLLTPGLPYIEQAAIVCDDAEFYQIMREAFPNAPWLWQDLPGAPEHERPERRALIDKKFRRYFEGPDFEFSDATIRGRLFHEAAEEWDFDNPGASHD